MLRQVDAAHATGAEQFQQSVLAEGEPLVAALEELVDLPAGEHPRVDERRQHGLGRRPGVPHPRRHERRQLRLLDQPAAADDGQEVVDGLDRSGHRGGQSG